MENPGNHSGIVFPNQDSDDSKEGANGGSDALAKGISSMLTTIITDFDSKAEETLKSQNHLSFALDRLTGELDKLLEDAPLPFIMQYAAKISTVRKRVSSLNSLLKSIQRRVDNMDRMLSANTHGFSDRSLEMGVFGDFDL